ncbi:MAG: hypothetical protein MUE73_12545 [Planctomycetes bacterium]|jgi:hypothetical protein|nr:hypothetical protein [Planctomycetota bacterium]
MRTVLVSSRAIIVVALALFAGGGAAGEDRMPDRKEITKQVLDHCRARDSYAAAEYVQALGEPPAAGRAYSDLVFDLHDACAVPEMVAMGRAGILWMLERARVLAATDPGKAANWRRAARQLSYNVASFTWPGWGEAGLVISEADRAAGDEAARLCLRLATELGEDHSSLFASQWIVGAHRLTAGLPGPAVEAFGMAREHARSGGDAAAALMAEGYAALTALLSGTGEEASLLAIVADLRKEGSEDAVFYADQIESVRKTLAK